MDPIGMVHGRFQPFHHEHLAYVLSGYKRCRQLLIGITNPEPAEYIFSPASDHRHLKESNPYTYFERMQMIRRSLIDVSLDMASISFVPFHLHNPSKWENYLPKPANVVQYVRVFSAWEEEKVRKFQLYGFEVKKIDPGIKKGVTATQVRSALLTNGNWRELVPAATAIIISKIKKGML